jgi:hypothetical protein
MSRRIWYISPYASDLNIGREYNEQIAQLPADDFICIVDQDVMFLHPKTKQQIEHIVRYKADGFDLLGCWTNRLGYGYQLPNGQREKERDPVYHYKMADKAHMCAYGVVREVEHPIAGFLMLFPRTTWEKTPFHENQLNFDYQFSHMIRKRGGRIGMMDGVYVYHYYRMHVPGNPHLDISHLTKPQM